MTRTVFWRLARLAVLAMLAANLSACDNTQVYGSIGVSSYGKLGGSGRVSGSISVGGRIR